MANGKKEKIIHWVLTIPVIGMMSMSAVGLLTPWPESAEGMAHLGYPLYFMTILGTAKALGVLALLYKRFPTLTEWAYAGFTFNLLSAAYSHLSAGDEVAKTISPLVILGILAGSYHFWKRGLLLQGKS